MEALFEKKARSFCRRVAGAAKVAMAKTNNAEKIWREIIIYLPLQDQTNVR
jgi:hypothetical protein